MVKSVIESFRVSKNSMFSFVSGRMEVELLILSAASWIANADSSDTVAIGRRRKGEISESREEEDRGEKSANVRGKVKKRDEGKPNLPSPRVPRRVRNVEIRTFLGAPVPAPPGHTGGRGKKGSLTCLEGGATNGIKRVGQGFLI